MPYKDYIELVNYFKALPDTVTDLKSATVGADEEDLNQQNSRIRYPHMRVDTPEINYPNDDSEMVTRYSFQIFVLTNEPRKTNDEENKALSAMEKIVRKIIKQLWADADTGLFDMAPAEKDADAVRRWSGDNLFGWRFLVRIDLWTDECA